jgi:catechol 2,3-dioxygenase-like lactoylglutathione lyase family enzyme
MLSCKLMFRMDLETRMAAPRISSISPSFIVRNVPVAISFYRDMLGFEVEYQQPKRDPFFAIVRRDGAMIFVKSVGAEPLPNRKRSAPEVAARWDAYVSVPDPDALAAEFISRGVKFHEPLKDTHDGLRGFEIEDADGYLLFFGRPREKAK